MIRDAVDDDHLAYRLGWHAHPAHRIDGFGNRRDVGAPGVVGRRVAPRHELGEDGDRDLLLAQRAQVEAGGAADAGQSGIVDSALAQDIEDGRRPPVLATSPT